MGMFDYIVLKCPWCNKEVEEQTKAGGCMMKTYRPGDSSFMDLTMVGEYTCYNCKKHFEVKLTQKPVIEIQKRPGRTYRNP